MDDDPLAAAVAALRRGDEYAHWHVDELQALLEKEGETGPGRMYVAYPGGRYWLALDAIRKAGVIPPLVALLKRGSSEQKLNTLVLLGTLATGNDGRQAAIPAIRAADGIPLLVPFLSGGATAKRTAAKLLCPLAVGDAESKVAIREAGAIPPLLRFAKSGIAGSDHASETLLNLISNNDDNAVAIALARGAGDEALVELAWRGQVVVRFSGRIASAAAAGAQRKAKLAVVALVCKRNWHFRRLDFPAVPHVLNAAIASYLY